MLSRKNIAYNYQCRKCLVVKKGSIIPSAYNCEKGGLHVWNDLGLVGRNTYYCKGCDATIRSKFKPYSAGCIGSKEHTWKLKVKPRVTLLTY